MILLCMKNGLPNAINLGVDTIYIITEYYWGVEENKDWQNFMYI